ncbi:MAG TPA: bifunctional diaminohydroxyphosphoribosylaminopyrimidine deaminase/5-amino-6-(5-phosphoribosylamino)uracil reductase RibD [Gammaproteobacteria bacterium]|nr:bifunctional diaminohydroxyphosphoribosylaminopyrimidine deaminase/5-amino-6-(5-phosphoribosylamino)uracil reductase RibD [Gammaproteobacteria bacterium]
MSLTLSLASRGLYTTDPNPRVGCILVNGGSIVGQGWHQKPGGPHAEIMALEEAGEKANGAVCYVSLEPCCHQGKTPPCTDALIKAGVQRVVAAMTDPNPQVAGQGIEQLIQAGVPAVAGISAADAEALNIGFVTRMSLGRPYVRCKLAMSLDGRTALKSGESRWITSAEARQDVQRLRARSSAILTGIGTVLVDDPGLRVRLEELGAYPAEEVRQPLRVVVDTHLSLPEDANVLKSPGSCLIATTRSYDGYSKNLEDKGAEVLCLPQKGRHGGVDMLQLLQELGKREVNEVLLEAGATLAGHMLQQGLIDELVVYMAPKLMGDEAKGLFHLPGLETMDQICSLDIANVRHVGADLRITAHPIYTEKA